MRHFDIITIAAGLSLSLTAAASAQGARLQEVKDAGTIRVCTVDYAPLVQKDPRSNEWQGLYIDLVGELAAGMNVKVSYVESAWKTFVQNLQSDKCDISIAPAYPTPERMTQVLFTDPVSEDGQAVWVRGDSDLKSLADIDQAGKVVGVRAGSANEKYAREMFKSAEIKLIVSDVQAATLMEVMTKRIDAALIATMSAQNMIASNPNLGEIVSVGEPQFASSIAWSVPLGEEGLQKAVNDFFTQAKASGKLDELRGKWLKQ